MPPWEAAGQSPTGAPHSPALLAGPPGCPASPHGRAQAALASLWQLFSRLSPLARRHKGDPLCSAPVRPRLGTFPLWGPGQEGGRDKGTEGLRGGTEGLWGWGWFSTQQRRRWGTSQHSPVPTGKASGGWRQALPSTAWWEGERWWRLLKLERFRLEIRHQNQNPCEDHEALEWVAQRGCGIPEPAGQPSRPEWPQPRASRSTIHC